SPAFPTLSLHDALPICLCLLADRVDDGLVLVAEVRAHELRAHVEVAVAGVVPEVDALGLRDDHRLPALLGAPRSEGVLRDDLARSEEHTSELQSQSNLV